MADDHDGAKGGGEDPCLHRDYGLLGEKPFAQVEADASYWSEQCILRTPTVSEVIRALGPDAIAEYPPEPTGEELDLLDDRFSFARSHDDFSEQQQQELGVFLTDPAFIANPPAGTVVNQRIRTGRLPIVRNGAELATLFEAEKTAIWHQHVLLTLLDLPVTQDGRQVRLREIISPVRQALMQSALHMATLSALTVMWRLKWRAYPNLDNEQRVARRERPAEYFARCGKTFEVLFDREIRIDANGDILRNLDKRRVPGFAPGSPRHPAYGSGHSVYSKAASDVLKLFLPRRWGHFADLHEGLDRLANSIGTARLWGGVHWWQDHIFGQRVGAAVAGLIRQQLRASLIAPVPRDELKPPSRRTLEDRFAEAQAQEQDWDAANTFAPSGSDPGIQGGRVTI